MGIHEINEICSVLIFKKHTSIFKKMWVIKGNIHSQKKKKKNVKSVVKK